MKRFTNWMRDFFGMPDESKVGTYRIIHDKAGFGMYTVERLDAIIGPAGYTVIAWVTVRELCDSIEFARKVIAGDKRLRSAGTVVEEAE